MQDLVFFAGLLPDRFVAGWIEGQTLGLDLLHAHGVEQAPELLVDGTHTLDPVEARECRIHRSHCPVEVVVDGQEIDDDSGVGEPGVLATLLLNAALEIGEVSGSPLPVFEVRLRLLALCGQLIDGGALGRRCCFAGSRHVITHSRRRAFVDEALIG